MFATVTHTSNNHHLESVICLNIDATNLLELREEFYIYIALLNIKMYLTFIYLLKLYICEKYYSHFTKNGKWLCRKPDDVAVGHNTRKDYSEKLAHAFFPACACMHENITIPAAISLWNFGGTNRTKFLELPWEGKVSWDETLL